MVTGGSFAYFDRVRTFAQACSAAAGEARCQRRCRGALRGLSLERAELRLLPLLRGRLPRARAAAAGLPLRREVTAILRGDRDP